MSESVSRQAIDGSDAARVGTQPQPVYDLHAVHFRYRSGAADQRSWVLDDVSLRIYAGEILGIVGPNGSGKSSLLKVLAKLAQPQQGRVCLFGQDLTEMSQEDVARLVGLVPQDSQQHFPFTVAETVLMGRYPHRPRARWSGGFGWEGEDDLAIAHEAMATLDILHLSRRWITDLSGGERQRTLIARAVAQASRVMLLDEPTAFLDLQHQVEMCSVLRRLREVRGWTVVVVSHDLNLVSQHCDRILLLDGGRVSHVGFPEEVIQPQVLEAVYRCRILVDRHPATGRPRVTLPGASRQAGRP